MYTFRTMVLDADNFEKYMTPEMLEMHLRGDKSFEDPRITKVGKTLRKLSLDELPQLADVFLCNVCKFGLKTCALRPPGSTTLPSGEGMATVKDRTL